MFRRWLLALALLVSTTPAGAVGTDEPLVMPTGPISFAGKPSGSDTTSLYKPDGDGPFPAVVIMPTCGGVRSETFDSAKRALDAGFVALVVDTLGPRGVKINCTPPLPVLPKRLAQDAFDALAHLRKFPFVDPNRVSVIGMSQGAGIALVVSGTGAYANTVMFNPNPPDKGFASAVALYPVCGWPERNIRYVPTKIATPLLVLMGSEDNETPPDICDKMFAEQKASGAPVEWETYKGATHCFDCSSLHNFKKKDWRGEQVEYRYDADLTKAVARRAFEFMGGAKTP